MISKDSREYIKGFLGECVQTLNNIPESEWVNTWFILRRTFFDLHSQFVFSTRFNATSYFEEVLYHVKENIPVKNEKDKNGNRPPLGNEDKNFNTWLKLLK